MRKKPLWRNFILVVSRVIKQFQCEVPLQVLFQSPTVAEMAAVIAEQQTKKLGIIRSERSWLSWNR